MERCKSYRITPTYLQIRCPTKSAHAQRLTKRYQLDLLKETLHLERKKWHRLSHNIRKIEETLQQGLTYDDYSLISRISDSTYEGSFHKDKERLKKRFEKLKDKYVRPDSLKRPSLIKNPLLELQKDNPLPPKAVSVLSLGPKFAVTPQVIPKLEIISKIEKTWQTLERKGEKDKPQKLRDDVTNILKKAQKPKSNLTAQQ